MATKLDFTDPFAASTPNAALDFDDPFAAPTPTPAPTPAAPKSGLIRRTLGDGTAKLAQGVIGLGESAVGIADLATGGRAGRSLEGIGYRPEEAKKIIGEYLSPEYKKAEANVQEAEGFTGTVGAMLENPSTIAGAVAESVPLMLGGGAVARGLGGVSKLGGVARAAIGEGAVGAGAAAEGLRQQSEDGLLSGRQTVAAIGSGVGTGLLGAAGGSVARRLGIGDVDTSLAGDVVAAADRPGLIRRTLGGAVSEGVLEEAPQSAQEQAWDNFANERPLGEGVGEATAAGLLTGAAIGGPFGAISGSGKPPNAPEDAPPSNEIAPELLALPSPASIDEGNITVDSQGNAVTELQVTQQRIAEAEAAQGRAARGLTPDVNAARAQHPSAAPNTLPDGSPIPSPDNGPLSRGVNIGVDTGAVQEAAAQQIIAASDEAAEQAAKQAKTIDGDAKRVLPEPMPPPNMDPQTGELVPYTEQDVRNYVNHLLDRGNKTPSKVLADSFGMEPLAMRDLIVSVRDERKKAALGDRDVRKRLETEFTNLPNDPTDGTSMSFGEGTALSEDARAFNEEMDISGDHDLAQAAGQKAYDSTNSMAREIENAPATGRPDAGRIDDAARDAVGAGRVSGQGVDGDDVSTRARTADQAAESVAAAAATDRAPVEGLTAKRLPKDLAKASPRYSYGDKKFELDFASDADRAAYIAAQAKPSKRDADYLRFAQEATGLDEVGVRARGAEIRASIKAMAKDAVPGRLVLPAFDSGAAVPATPTPAGGATGAAQAAVKALQALNPQLKNELRVELLSAAEMGSRPTNTMSGTGASAGSVGAVINLLDSGATFSQVREEVRHLIDKLLGGSQVAKWIDDDTDMQSRVRKFLNGRRDRAPDTRYDDGAEIAQSLLDQYFRNPDAVRGALPDMFTYLEQMGAAKYRSVMEAIDAAERQPTASAQAGSARPPQDAPTAPQVQAAAAEAATSPTNDRPEPTEAQKEAGNYKKGHARVAGLDVSIENPAGSRRRPEWPPLENHYGYFKGTIGADKDHVDVFLTDRAEDASLPVFVVDQNHRNGKFDEAKVIMGTADEAEARAAYLSNYEKGWNGLGAITQMSQDEFKAWVKDPAKTVKPAAGTALAPSIAPAGVRMGGQTYPVNDLADAQRRFKEFVNRGGEGARGTPTVDIVNAAGDVVGHFSYNGRMWQGPRGANNAPELMPDGSVRSIEQVRQAGKERADELLGRNPAREVQQATPDALVTVRDIYGASYQVKQSELDGDRKMLPTYSKDGTRRETKKGPTNLHRENIATDEQIAEHNKATKLVSRRGARNEREEGFSKPEVVTREIKRLGQNPADFDIKPHHGGYVGVRKAAAATVTKEAQHPKSTAPEHVIPEGGITPMTPEQIKQVAAEWREHIDGGGDSAVTRVFDAPQERDRVRLEKSAGVTSAIENGTRVYHREAGWMTLEEAAARVAEWRGNARSQGGAASVRNGNSQKVVLSLFDKTGSWAEPWADAGYQVYTFDIQNDPDIGDVNKFSMEHFIENFGMFEGNEVYAILAACPCTDFAVSGSRHFAGKDNDGRTQLSVQLVNQTLATVEYFKPPVWAIENPVGRIEKLTGLPPWTVAFDPFQVGPHPYTKRTQLWGRMNGNLPTAPVEPTQGSKMHSQYGGKSQKTKDARSETPEGFAYAFFQANNAVDHPVMAVANRFDRLDRDLIAQAVNAGFTEEQIATAVEDDYYDLNDEAASAAVQELIDTPPENKPGRREVTNAADDAGSSATVVPPPAAPRRSYAEVVASLRAMTQGSSYPVNGTPWYWAPGGNFSDGKTTITPEKLADAIVAGRDPSNVDALEGEFARVDAKPDKALLIPRRAPNGGVAIEVQPINPPAPAVSANTIFTEEAAEAARKVLRAKLGQLNTGIDPEIMQAGITLAGYHIENGARTFAAYSKAMVADLGEAIRPYLKSWYMGVKFDPRATAFDGMDTAASVEAADIESQSDQRPASPANVAQNAAEEAPNVRRQDNRASDREGGVRSNQREQPAQERDDDAAANLDTEQWDEAARAGTDGRPAESAPTPAPGSTRGSVRPADPQSAPDADRVPAERGTPADSVTPKSDLTVTRELDFTGVGAVGKFKQNLTAIALLKELEAQDRRATPAEQSILARYVGWGGLPQAFRHPTTGKVNKGWEARVDELEAAMTAEEHAAAGRSTQDAHYTAANVVSAMWDAVQRMGFQRGRVLEPSMGTGNFFGLMPTDTRAASNLTGVELDSITGRIAKQLYQNANVQVRGFNDIRIAPASFDLAIGNPPFGAQTIHDPQYPELAGSSIHNYFFAKSIASLRPGGVLAMVVSSSFMDANTSKTRKWISERANLLGAIRLPNTAFQANAGTNVTTDIVFLQRLPEGAKSNPEAWVRVGSASDKGNHFALNKYFVDNPNMMLGNMVWSTHTTIGRAGAVLEANPDADLAVALNEAIAKLPQDVYQAPGKTFKQATAKVDEVNTSRTVPVGARVYGYFAHSDGTLRQRQPDYNGEMQSTAVELSESATARVIGMANIRDLARDLLAAEHRESATDAHIEAKRAALNTAYDAFVKAHGRLSRDVNKRLYRDDTDMALLLSLERDYDNGVSPTVAKKMGVPSRKESAGKADLFKKRLNYPTKPVTEVTDAKSAMLASLNERGRLDPEYMAGIYPGKTIEDIETELGDQVFREPSGELVPADLYLSGNVKAKLAATKEAAKTDSRLERNVAALEAVQPVDVDATDIFVQVGTPWIPASDYADFARETFEGALTGSYVAALGGWRVSIGATNQLLNNERWGHERLGAASILELLMANKPVAIYDKGPDNTRILNKDDTAAAKGKAEELQQHFLDWIWKDAGRRERLSRHYNDTYNTDVRWKPSGEHMTFPGKTDAITLRPHQSAFAYRVVQQGVALADHVVGAGKTFANIAAVMEMRRLGLWRKPMIAVPNHLVDQWAKDFALLYPGANVLAATRKDFAKPNRKKLFARIATGDWDAVIVAHSSFGFIPLPPATEQEILNSEVAEITVALDAMRENNGKKDLSYKQLQKRKDAIEAKIDALADRPRDDLMDFAEMGVDALSVDEAHEFKNLYFVTTQRGVAGLGSPEGSKKAFDLFVKTRYLAELNGGKNRVFLTGTPVSNSLAEVFHMQRYLQLEELKDRGVAMFDTWASTFGQIVSDWEMDAAGRFKEKSRFRKFANLPELVTLWRGVSDTVTLADLKRDAVAQGKRFPVPKIKGGKRNNITVPRSPEQAAFIGVPEPVMNPDGTPAVDKETGIPVEQYPEGSIIHRMDNMPKDPSIDNHLKATGDARKASLDYRLVDPDAPDFAGSKINRAVTDIADIWEANTYRRGTQLVFADLSVPASARGKATESAQARVPTWFIARGNGIEHVAGVKLALSAMQGRPFFSFKTKRDGYAIYEAGSGLYVTSGKTKQEAIDNGNATLANKPKTWLADFEAATIPAEAIDAYVQQWEDEKARKEEEAADTDSNEKAPEQETISMDDLLADQSKHSVYDDVKAKLIAKGIPAREIAFIHDYNTDAQKADLFAKVNRGDIRVLMGSTAKMGAGMNVQKKLVALHHLDAPWRPSDMTQREGRAIRQGNEFYEADPDGFEMILNAYGTQETYDSRQYEIIETKAQGIETFQAGDSDVREIDDIASESANSADMKAAASGNPLILESIKLRKEVRDLEAQEKSHKRAVHAMESLVRSVDNKSSYAYKRLKDAESRAKRVGEEEFKLTIGGKTITDPKELKVEPLMVAFKAAIERRDATVAGEFRGLDVVVEARQTSMRVSLYDGSDSVGSTEIGRDDKVNPAGFVTRLDNIFKRIAAAVPDAEAGVAKVEREAAQAREEMKRGFPKADELTRKRERQQAVVGALRSGKRAVEGDAAPQFSRPDRPASGGMTAEQVTRSIGSTTATFGANAPDVVVLATAKDLPASAKRDPGYRTAEGFYENGTAYLVAENLRSPTRAVQTLAHEVVGHFGVEAITGPELWADLGRTIDTMRRSGKHVPLFAEIDRRYNKDGKAKPDLLVRESIAVMAEKGIRNSVVDRTIAALRRFLRSLGFTLEFTEAELRQHIIRAARFVRGSATPPSGGRRPLSEFLRGAPVAITEGTRFKMKQDGLRKRVVDYYKQAHNGRAFNPQAGEVLLTGRGIKDSVGHGLGQAKTAAFELVPNVIRDGRLISESVHYEGKRNDRLIIAAPVNIAGEDYLMAVVMNRDVNGGRYYFHDVELTPKKEPPQAVLTGATIAGGVTGGHAGVIPTLLREAYEGKRDSLFSRADPVESSAFKDWFRKSKVATAGVPKVAYHGTADEFWAFDAGRLGGSTGHMTAPLGFFFDENRSKAQRYAENASEGVPADERVIDVYLSIQNPKRMTLAEFQAIDDRAEAVAVRERLIRQGFDGIQLAEQGQWIAFEPSQAKSASENTGSFDPGSDDMRFSKSDPAATIDAVDAMLGGPPDSALDKIKGLFRALKPENLRENTRPAWLGALPLRQLAELGADIKLSQLSQYGDRVQRMATDRNVMQEEASATADDWERLQRKDRKAADETANLMHDTTIAGVDPSRAYVPMTTGTTKRGPDEPVTKENIDRRKAAVAADLARTRSAEARQRLSEEAKALDELLANEQRRQAAYPAFERRFQALPAAAQKLYNDARDAYSQQSDRIEAALIGRIEALKADDRQKAAMIGQVRQQFESARLTGPYFPLQRFGDFWINARSAAGESAFMMYEKVEQWREAQRDLKARGFTIENAGRKLDDARSLTGASGGFMADLQALLDTAGVDEDTRDEVYQLYLRTLPELSMRKHQIHRKATAGYSEDALRAFSSNLFHGSFQIARLRHAHELEADLLSMKEAVNAMTADDPERAVKAAALYAEANKRHEWVMNPKDSKVASALTSLGFAWYLGTTPAAAMVNLTQTAIVTFPVLAAKFGPTKAFNALSSGMARALRNVDGDLTRGLNVEEQAAFKAWYASGAIDRSQAHNLAGLSETDTRAYSPVARRTMEVVSFMFHKAEVVNREATALAAYRLAREAGQGVAEATTYAADVVTESHFDYSNANRARFMQGNAAKVLLLFRQYSLNMTWFLWRNFYLSTKGESAQVKKEARIKLGGVLGMTSLFAGTLGLPLSSVIFGIANAAAAAFGDDDDDPWDADVEFRNFLADMLGPDVGRIIANGPVDYFTGASFSTRVGLDDLWFREPNRELEGKAMANYILEQAAGPLFGGMLVNTLRGMQQVNEGHTWRGVETMSPKVLKDGMKALRYSTQGVNTFRGDPVIEDLSVGQSLLQLAGFAPAELNDRYDSINASKEFETKIMDRRSSLLNAYAMAWRAGDADTVRDVVKKIRNFNQKQPRVAITMSTIRNSLSARMRYSSRAEGGVVLNPKLADRARNQGRFAE